MSIVERTIAKSRGDNAPGGTYGRLVEAPRVGANDRVTPLQPSRIVAVDQAALHRVGILPPDHQRRQISSQYRHIKRPLLANAFARERAALPRGRLIMVGSAMPGEGKTFTSINMAFSMARDKDVHLLLIDGDVLKPQTSRTFGIEKERGFTDALADPSADIESFIIGTDVPNLTIMPAGSQSEVATELFASQRMTDVLQELLRRDPRRVVLLDSSPLIPTTESRELAAKVGQIVVVVRADHTEHDTVQEALSFLPENASVSLVLNQSVAKEEAVYAYYGYGVDPQTQGSA